LLGKTDGVVSQLQVSDRIFLSEEHGSPSSSVLADVPELEIERVLDSSLLHRANGQAEFLVRSVADSEVLLFLGVWWHLE